MHVVTHYYIANEENMKKTPQQWNWIECWARAQYAQQTVMMIWNMNCTRWMHVDACLSSQMNVCFCKSIRTEHTHSSDGCAVQSMKKISQTQAHTHSYEIAVKSVWLTAFDDLQISFRSQFDKFEFNLLRHFYLNLCVHKLCLVQQLQFIFIQSSLLSV